MRQRKPFQADQRSRVKRLMVLCLFLLASWAQQKRSKGRAEGGIETIPTGRRLLTSDKTPESWSYRDRAADESGGWNAGSGACPSETMNHETRHGI